MHILFQIDLFSWIEETHVSLERKPSKLEGGASSTLLPVRIVWLLERNAFCESEFSRGRIPHFVQNRPMQLSWRNTCISLKKTIYVWRWSIKHVFSCDNWVVFKRNTACLSGFNSGRNAHFVPNRPIQLSWRNTCTSWKKTIEVRRRSIKQVISQSELSQFLKGILPSNQGNKRWEMLIFFQIGLFIWIVETDVSVKRKVSMLEGGKSGTLFPSENWVSF
jgi:hypothetical protein